MSNFNISKPLIPVGNDKHKFIILRAARRFGKTYFACQLACLKAIANKELKILWVDTVQANIKRYIAEYFRPILGELWKSVEYDRQQNTLTFLNGSKIYFGSAERPENLEGFDYHLIFLNEAGIILKKEGLWYNTIQPMSKNGRVYFIGTPKGKTGHIYYELSQKGKEDPDWNEYHLPAIKSPFYTQKELDKIKSQIPTFLWLQNYEAEFVDVYENSMIPPDCLRFYDFVDLNNFDKVFIHADTTHTAKTTSDYFALVVMGENKKDHNYYVLDFILDKIDVEKQALSLINIYQKYGKKVSKITYDEKANQGFGYWSKKLAREDFNLSLPLQELKYNQDKVNHFTPHTKHFLNNRVYLPKNHNRLNLATDQLLAFPQKGVNDDFVDGISGCLDNFNQTKSNLENYFETINQIL